MALTDTEKVNLRQAICDGAFSQVNQAPNGQLQRGAITPEVLASVASKSDDEIRAVLLLWKTNKVATLTKQVAQLNAQLAVANTALTGLQA